MTEFDNLSIDAATYSWTFGDGGTSSLEEPSHEFPTGMKSTTGT